MVVAATTAYLHGMLHRSTANGPGVRFTLWFQGCSLGCTGCFNPQTHPTGQLPSSTPTPVTELADLVLAEVPDITGVTLTGGEPLEQPRAVARLCALVKARSDLGIVMLTGFDRREILADVERAAAVADVDMVVAGRYNARLHLARGLRGSSNKSYWARTDRYSADDFGRTPDLEIALSPDGELTVTGMLPVAGDLIEQRGPTTRQTKGP